MASISTTRFSLWLAPLLVAVNLSIASFILWPQRAFVLTGANDFLSFYAGGRLAFSGDLYNHQEVEAVQRQFAGTSSDKLIYIRPQFYAAALAPIARLPYRAAYIIWQCVQLGALLALIRLIAPEARKAWIFALCASTPLAWSFANGQDLPLLLLLITASSQLAGRGRYFRAGLVLSLCLFKPHLILLVPLAFLRRHRHAGLYGFALGGVLLFALSALVAGPYWLSPYIHLLWTGNIHAGLSSSPNWHGTARGVLGAPWAGWIMALLTGAATIIGMLKACWKQSVNLATVGMLLSVPHLFIQDLLLLIPVCLEMVATHSRSWVRAAAFLLLTPLPFLFQIALPFPSGQFLVFLEVSLLIGLLAPQAYTQCAIPPENQHSTL